MNKHILYYRFLLLLVLPLALPSAVFAQTQPPCSGTVSIVDTSRAQPGVLAVVSNSGQADFTVTGPKTYSGSGYYWVQQGIPAGTYTITWKPVSGCGTPPSETKITDSRGSVAFAGNYQNQTPVQTSPHPSPSAPSAGSLSGRFMTITSNPPSASVYINSVLVGTAPVKTKLPENVPIKIKCTAPNYSDYNYTYPAVGQLPSGVNSVNTDWTCTLKKISSASPESSPGGKNRPDNRIQNHDKTTPSSQAADAQPQNSQLENPPKPRGFFLRFLNSVSLFFKNLFGSEKSVQQSAYGNSGQAKSLQGAWRIEQVLMFDPTLNAFRQIPAEHKYIEFKGNRVCADGSYLANGNPRACERYNEFRIEGNAIISEGLPSDQTVKFLFRGDALELSIEPENTIIGRAQKLTLSRIENFKPEMP